MKADDPKIQAIDDAISEILSEIVWAKQVRYAGLFMSTGQALPMKISGADEHIAVGDILENATLQAEHKELVRLMHASRLRKKREDPEVVKKVAAIKKLTQDLGMRAVAERDDDQGPIHDYLRRKYYDWAIRNRERLLNDAEEKKRHAFMKRGAGTTTTKARDGDAGGKSSLAQERENEEKRKREAIRQKRAEDIQRRKEAKEAAEAKAIETRDNRDQHKQLVQSGKAKIQARAIMQRILVNAQHLGEQESFSEGDLQKLRSHFELIDVDGSGHIDKTEFVNFFQDIVGTTFSKKDIVLVFEKLDADNTASLDFEEFVKVYRLMAFASKEGTGALNRLNSEGEMDMAPKRGKSLANVKSSAFLKPGGVRQSRRSTGGASSNSNQLDDVAPQEVSEEGSDDDSDGGGRKRRSSSNGGATPRSTMSLKESNLRSRRSRAALDREQRKKTESARNLEQGTERDARKSVQAQRGQEIQAKREQMRQQRELAKRQSTIRLGRSKSGVLSNTSNAPSSRGSSNNNTKSKKIEGAGEEVGSDGSSDSDNDNAKDNASPLGNNFGRKSNVQPRKRNVSIFATDPDGEDSSPTSRLPHPPPGAPSIDRTRSNVLQQGESRTNLTLGRKSTLNNNNSKSPSRAPSSSSIAKGGASGSSASPLSPQPPKRTSSKGPSSSNPRTTGRK
eukprot:TRINITY_DN1124_c0_g1_i5.p1 TRINITY_DN1124_c0_g1~~TRINITY_DN1124_c0_g1_i5.p1  ORF type:complete len:676 (+),score=160.36 TRINITY_DN1124_c0_g1_i5:389-2416(+)